MIRVEQGGLLSVIQDQGRTGLRYLGIPSSGTLVPAWMHLANTLVGNPADTPVIECHEGGLQLAVHDQTALVAILGDAEVVTVRTNSQAQTLEPWTAHALAPGSSITIKSSGRYRLCVVAIAGFCPAQHLASASTYVRASLGGIEGRALQSADELPVSTPLAIEPGVCCEPFMPYEEKNVSSEEQAIALAAVPGPQMDAFSKAAINNFFNEEYTLSRDADRMGARLHGPVLEHKSVSERDIVSDAIVPGSVQVPGNGQPIVLLADAHTAGGYPKIATVVSSELAKLALYRTGQRFRFEKVDADAAVLLTREHHANMKRHAATLHKAADVSIDPSLLIQNNLIDGVVNAREC